MNRATVSAASNGDIMQRDGGRGLVNQALPQRDERRGLDASPATDKTHVDGGPGGRTNEYLHM